MSNELDEAMAKQRALDAAKKAAEKAEKKPVNLKKLPELKWVKLDKPEDIVPTKADQATKSKPIEANLKPSKLSERLKKTTESVKKWKWWHWLLLLILLLLLIRYWSFFIGILIGIPIIILLIGLALAILYYIFERIRPFLWLILLVLILGFIAIQPPTRSMTAQEIADRNAPAPVIPFWIRVVDTNQPGACGVYFNTETGVEVHVVDNSTNLPDVFLRVVDTSGVIKYYFISSNTANVSAQNVAPFVEMSTNQVRTLSDHPFVKISDKCPSPENQGVDIIYN